MMRMIFDTCSPRQDVLSGELRDDMFAAGLGNVIDGSADPIYQDAARFFENTYPTAGLKSLLSEVLGRLAGSASSSAVIRLETTFGGGKTHNLIAVYHLARAPVPPSAVAGFLDPGLLPAKPLGRVAGVAGSDLELGGLDHRDAKTFTLWGEIAYRLGGAEGYKLVQELDEAGSAPGCQFIEQIAGQEPVLIMLDELARHLRSARGQTVGDSTLAEQTVGFLMSLLELASSRDRTAVVITLAGPQDAFAKETEMMQKELAEAKSVSARRERVLTPAAEDERPAIVAHRLFASVDRSAAAETAHTYREYFERVAAQDVELPERSQRAEYEQQITANYPFHPELLTTLNRKTSTIPNFQSTRGALRLLAMTVQQLWKERPSDAWLIHPHHLNLANEGIVNDLTSRLDRPQFRQVVEADIASPVAGTPAHAANVDRVFTEAGKPPYARRAATAIFLHSLTQGVASGVDPADLNLAVLQPGDEPSLVRRALDELVDTCWFLDWDGRRYRFGTEPSLNKVVADEIGSVGRVKAKDELDQRIRSVWKKGFLHPEYFPSEAAEVDDDAREPKLVTIHYDAASVRATDDGPPELVRKIFDYAGSQSGYRIYRNNLVFLVADHDQIDNMIDQARRYLATGRIVGDPDRMAEFGDEQRKKLRAMYDAADLEVRIAITRAYRYLFYPSQDAPEKHSHLQRETLPAQDQGDVKKDQTEVVLRVLKGLDKVLTADDAPMPPAFVKAKAWTAGRDSVTTEELRKAFAQRTGLKMLLDVNQLKATIKAGVSSGAWVYYDAQEQMGYGRSSPAPLVQIGEDFELYTPEEAARVGIRIKGEDGDKRICPVCHEDPCVCAIEEPPKTKQLSAAGAPAQVFQAIVDQAHDKGIQAITRLMITCEGSGKEGMQDVLAMGLAIPQFGKGEYRVELSPLVAEFGTDEYLQATFRGDWNRYKRLKTVTDAFGQEASKVAAKMTVTAEFPGGLALDEAQYQTIRDVLTSLSLGKLVVLADPLEAGEPK
jgi:hypothetical protein